MQKKNQIIPFQPAIKGLSQQDLSHLISSERTSVDVAFWGNYEKWKKEFDYENPSLPPEGFPPYLMYLLSHGGLRDPIYLEQKGFNLLFEALFNAIENQWPKDGEDNSIDIKDESTEKTPNDVKSVLDIIATVITIREQFIQNNHLLLEYNQSEKSKENNYFRQFSPRIINALGTSFSEEETRRIISFIKETFSNIEDALGDLRHNSMVYHELTDHVQKNRTQITVLDEMKEQLEAFIESLPDMEQGSV